MLLFLPHAIDLLLDGVHLLLSALDLAVQLRHVVEQREVLRLLLQKLRDDRVHVVQLGNLPDAVERLLVLVQSLQVRIQGLSDVCRVQPAPKKRQRRFGWSNYAVVAGIIIIIIIIRGVDNMGLGILTPDCPEYM